VTPKRVLVTGGAGFIGSHLCERLLGEGHEVLCMDNLYTGTRANISHLLGSDRFLFRYHDVTEPFIVAADEIYHLACPASPVQYRRNAVGTIRTAVQGTMHALEAARDAGAAVFIASTSEVYGDPEVHPQPESYWGHVNPVGPRACYDEGKRCAEALAVNFARQFGVQVRIARIFNTYGPRMRENDGRAVSSFVTQALRGEPLTIFGDGSQTRSFCFVDELIDGITRLMSATGEIGPVNLGNPEEVTVAQIAREVIRLTGTDARISHLPLPEDDPVRRRPDISRASEVLGWAPKIPLEEGLRRTIAAFAERRRRQDDDWRPKSDLDRRVA
jgi:UDP-glucuronate decarboxylase